jgi:serine/threonine protein kinase
MHSFSILTYLLKSQTILPTSPPDSRPTPTPILTSTLVKAPKRLPLPNPHQDNDGKEEKKELSKPLSPLMTLGLSVKFTIAIEEISWGESIGKGSFGSVFKATWRTQPVAIKYFKPEAKTSFEGELKVIDRLQKLNLPSVVEYYGHSSSVYGYVIIMEYMSLGSVFDRINSKSKIQPPGISLKSCYKILENIAAAFESLEDNGIIHGDPKLQNVMLSKDDEIKLTDFGSGFLLNPGETHKDLSFTPFMTLGYTAPEVIRAEASYDPKAAEVFSFGWMMWCMIAGRSPYWGLPEEEVIRKSKIGEVEEIPKNCPPELGKLIEKCRMFAPKDRISFSGARHELKTLRILEEHKEVTSRSFTAH